MNIFDSVLPKSMPRFVMGLSALGLVFAGSVYAAPPDKEAPDTIIDSSPGNPSSSDSATFAFHGTDNVGVTGYQCALDTAGFANCTSPKVINGLSEGAHTFKVRAKDAEGNVDASPAQYTWTVDTDVPDTKKPVMETAYISSGGTLLVLKYNEDLNDKSVPAAKDFKVDDGSFLSVSVSVSDAHVTGTEVVLELGKSIQAAKLDKDGKSIPVEVDVSYTGTAIKDIAGNAALTFFEEPADNNSANYPLSYSFIAPGGRVECGASKVEMNDVGKITVLATNCSDSMLDPGPSDGNVVFEDVGGGLSYCGSFTSFNMDGSGHASITTGENCVADRDSDGIPGVVDADPDFLASNACVEEAFGEVNLANGNATFCSGTVSVVTGKAVRVSSNTEYAAGEFIRLLPGFSVQQGKEFVANTGPEYL